MSMEVVLITTSRCEFCDDAHRTFERLAREYSLSITTIDLDSPTGQAFAAEHGLTFPPGVVLDGRPFSHGRLSERKLRRELDRKTAS
jgi:thiol-disulfide isomerase/thioredoxin